MLPNSFYDTNIDNIADEDEDTRDDDTISTNCLFVLSAGISTLMLQMFSRAVCIHLHIFEVSTHSWFVAKEVIEAYVNMLSLLQQPGCY